MIAVVLCALFLATASAADSKDGRIVNGLPAGPGLFPHQVGLDLRGAQGSFWCGGSLISDRWILTAAHCTRDAIQGVATLGSTDRFRARQSVQFARQNMYTHPQYNPTTLLNDIALISIPPVALSSEVLPIAMENNPSISFANTVAIASGWGLTRDNSNVSPVLNYARLLVVDNSHSAQYYPGLITTNNICVSTAQGSSTCQGDSGGPLAVVGPNGKYVLIGVTSFGSRAGCQAGWPTCFSRVAAFRPWINSITGL